MFTMLTKFRLDSQFSTVSVEIALADAANATRPKHSTPRPHHRRVRRHVTKKSEAPSNQTNHQS
jgi:hypothetical protein